MGENNHSGAKWSAVFEKLVICSWIKMLLSLIGKDYVLSSSSSLWGHFCGTLDLQIGLQAKRKALMNTEEHRPA